MQADRFITATAGNTTELLIDNVDRIGSSTRLRETRNSFVLQRLTHRFIPANAGKTVSTRTVLDWKSVYPHIREKHRSR